MTILLDAGHRANLAMGMLHSSDVGLLAAITV
jgi:hypothetical protein